MSSPGILEQKLHYILNSAFLQLLLTWKILQGFGQAFPILLLEESELLAEKMLTLFKRKRGRDIYDLFFMLRRKFPFDPEVLRSRGLPDSIEKALESFLLELGPEELKALRRQIEPFLFRAEEGEWIEKTPEYFRVFLGRERLPQ